MNQDNERRNNLRYQLALLDENKLQTFIVINNTEIKVRCMNLSLAGISFQLEKEKIDLLDKNSSYKFRFFINNSINIPALGQLIWKTQLDPKDKNCFSTGFHLFISEEKQKEELQNFLDTL